jgi:hypothetical protein
VREKRLLSGTFFGGQLGSKVDNAARARTSKGTWLFTNLSPSPDCSRTAAPPQFPGLSGASRSEILHALPVTTKRVTCE